jgi:tetratricopeptide (TPR) repeat protein
MKVERPVKISVIQDIELLKSFFDGKSILVVEPNANYRTSIRQFFANLKLTKIHYAATSKDALRELHTGGRKWGLICSEWALTDQNGIQLCREIRADENFQNVPFILMSVENLRSDVMIAGEMGINGYLLKPFSFEEFTSRIVSLAKNRVATPQVEKLISAAEELMKQKNFDEAASIFENVITIKPNSARSWHGLGLIALQKGDREKSVKFMLQAVGRNKQYLDAYRSLLQIFEEGENWEDMLKIARILNEESPDNPRYALKVALASLALNNLDEAEAFFRKVIRISPRLAAAYKGLGDVYIRQEDYEAAMENFHKAIDLDPNDVSIINSIAMTYVRIGKTEDGIKQYQAALRLEPENSLLIFNMGYAYERKGDFILAINCYKKASEIDPDFEKAKRFLERVKNLVQSAPLTAPQVGSPTLRSEDED